MVITPMWAQQMTAGRGWIALALVVFSGWRAVGLLVGSDFFGVLMDARASGRAQGLGLFVPALAVLGLRRPTSWLSSCSQSYSARSGRRQRSAALGRPFLPSS